MPLALFLGLEDGPPECFVHGLCFFVIMAVERAQGLRLPVEPGFPGQPMGRLAQEGPQAVKGASLGKYPRFSILEGLTRSDARDMGDGLAGQLEAEDGLREDFGAGAHG